MSKILVVVSSHSEWPEAGRSTGYWIGEVSHFADVVEAAGHGIDVVSPLGGEPPVDEKSVKGPQSMDGGYKAYQRNPGLQAKLRETLRPADVDPDAYAAIYYAGGHGCMWDFPDDKALIGVAERIWANGSMVTSVCHGAAGLLNLRRPDNALVLDGKRATGFANIEERMMGLTGKVPYALETRMREQGAVYRRGRPFLVHVEVDDQLITGQNPRSGAAVGQAVVERLEK